MSVGNDIFVKYDHLCYITFLNIKTKADGMDRICFKDFDASNKEHMFVLSVAISCYGLLNRNIAVPSFFWTRRRLNKHYDSSCKIEKITKEEKEKGISVCDMLEFMRGYACELVGPEFRFGDIYEAYYSKKERRKKQ